MIVGILNYGSGNILSVRNSLDKLKVKSKFVSKYGDFKSISKLIIPGVGSYNKVMKLLNQKNLVNPILDFNLAKKPILGICVGMQILSEYGKENELTKGLGIIPGTVEKMNDKFTNLSTNVGWMNIYKSKENIIFKNIDLSPDYYFDHSYHFVTKNKQNILCTSKIKKKFISGVFKNNCYGFQFHLEKSSTGGLKILENFCQF